MPSPDLFKDVSKRVNDLFTKEFPGDKAENKVEWKGKSGDVALETTLIQKKDGSVSATFTPKYDVKEWGANFLVELNTAKDVKAEASFKDQLAKNLKNIITLQSKGDDNWATLGLEYKHDLASVTASVDYGKASGSTVRASANVGSSGFTLGASTEYFIGFTQESDLKELHTILSYAKAEYDVAIFGRMKSENDTDKNELGLNYFHNVNSTLAVGAEITFDTANSDAKPKLTFGTQYQLAADSVLKGKFDTTGKLGLSYGQKWNKNARVVVSSSIDTNNLGGKNASAFGFTLALNSD
jgi:hypothetical protein